jgi:hypothetical protein
MWRRLLPPPSRQNSKPQEGKRYRHRGRFPNEPIGIRHKEGQWRQCLESYYEHSHRCATGFFLMFWGTHCALICRGWGVQDECHTREKGGGTSVCWSGLWRLGGVECKAVQCDRFEIWNIIWILTSYTQLWYSSMHVHCLKPPFGLRLYLWQSVWLRINI